MQYNAAIALVRPPGHHASSDRYGGFCIYNNAAIAARYLQAKKQARRIMFVDWDAHAGNGTMRIFYEDPTVLFVSIHRDPKEFYPNDGFAHQIGKGHGRGYTVNICMPEGAGDKEYDLALNEIILPLYDQFKPEFLIGCNGFDAHFSEELTKLQLSSTGYHNIVSSLREKARNHFAIMMEGGYNWYNTKLSHTIVNALVGLEVPYQDDIDTLASSVTNVKKTHAIVENEVKQLKEILSDYYRL